MLNSPKPLMIAHRGVSGLELENTCAAFVAAGNRSYFGIETDGKVIFENRDLCDQRFNHLFANLCDVSGQNSLRTRLFF